MFSGSVREHRRLVDVFHFLFFRGLVMSDAIRAIVLGQGVLGCHIAEHLKEGGVDDVIVIDRNDPFEPAPDRQTSAAAIGIIEPFGLKPTLRCRDWYLRTRRHYQDLAADEGLDFIREAPVRYLSNEDGYLDGRDGRASDENWHELPVDARQGFRFGEQFTGLLMCTTQYNHWIRRRLISSGVLFKKREVTDEPGEVRVDNKPVDVVFDCRGLGLRATDAGKNLYPISGQTVLLHAPDDIGSEGVLGNPGSEISFNIVYNWAKVTEETVRMLGLEHKVDWRRGGQFVLVGATKHRDDFNWDPQRYVADTLVAGASKLDPRVLEWPVVLARKGMRARLSEGILEQRRYYGETLVYSMAGWAGAAYCGSWAYAADAVEEFLSRLNGAKMFQAPAWK